MSDDSAYLRQGLMEVVDKQVVLNDPPQTRLTLERLTAAGHAPDEARRLVACVLAAEVHAVMTERRLFDERSYVKALEALPRLPWDD